MVKTKVCPACNGQGFVAKWDTTVPPKLHKCECVRCGGLGYVMKTEKRR